VFLRYPGERAAAIPVPGNQYRYGYAGDALLDTENRLRMAVEGKDWVLASRLAAELVEKRPGNA
jgi:hypothetical protein